MTKKVSAVRLAALALPLVLGLAACGDDGSSSSSGSGDPIKIAAVAAVSGGVSSNPEYGLGAEAAVKSINAAGGIKGRPLELQLCDNHQNATDAANCYRKMLADEDVVAIAGGSDNYRDSVKGQLEAARIPIMGQWPVSTFDITNPQAYNVNGSVVVGFSGIAHDVVEQGAKRVALVTLDIPTADVIRKSVGDVMAAAGVEIVNNVQLAPTTADLSAAAQQATKGDPDAVIWLTFATQTAVAVKALRATGYDRTIGFAGSAYDKATLEGMGAGGPLSVGLVLAPAWDTSTEYGKAYNADLAKYSPGAKVNELGLTSWLGVKMFAQVANSLDTVDRASVAAGLKQLTDVKTGGLTPPIDFAQPSPLPYKAIYNPAYATVHVTGGKAEWDGDLRDFSTGKPLS